MPFMPLFVVISNEAFAAVTRTLQDASRLFSETMGSSFQKEGEPNNMASGAKPVRQQNLEIWSPEILQQKREKQRISNTKATPTHSPPVSGF